MLQGGLMHLRLTALFVLMVALTTESVHAQKRIALLIGNEAYKREVGPLSNPINDVNLIAASLRKIGFAKNNIRIVKNGTRRQVLRAIERHTRRLSQAGDGAVGFLYYSGHGIANQETRRNYLIPVDVERLNADVWFDAVPLDEIVANLSKRAPRAANFVIFDACRNVLNTPTKGSKGFVPVQTRRGMLIAFSTDPGQTASDAGRGGGPYATALAEELAKPGVDHLDLFQNVKERVYRTTRVQVPWTRDGMLERVYLAGRQAATETRIPIDSRSLAATEWGKLKDTQDEAALRAFAKRHKGTVFAELAQGRLALNQLHKQTMSTIREMGKPTGSARTRCDGINVKLATGKFVCIKPGSGKSFKDCENCPEMVVVPAGSFKMGSNNGSMNETPVRQVTIGAPLIVGKFEVTFAEWLACYNEDGCDHKPSDQGWGRGKRPVINVSWDDITKQYLPWLSRKSGKRYGLLTEAQWEYLARAGTRSKYAWGDSIDCTKANFDGGSKPGCRNNPVGSFGGTQEVGSYKSNKFGLFDTHGNVWEWVQDCYNDSYRNAPTDGSAVVTGKCDRRVLRGGSWDDVAQLVRSATRVGVAPDDRDNLFGFRVVRMLTP